MSGIFWKKLTIPIIKNIIITMRRIIPQAGPPAAPAPPAAAPVPAPVALAPAFAPDFAPAFTVVLVAFLLESFAFLDNS